AAVALRKWRISGRDALPVAGFCVAVAAALQQMPFLAVSWDFEAYRRGAEAIRNGVTPYPNPTDYIYPPPLAQWLGSSASALTPLTRIVVADDTGWPAVFYLLQIAQLVAIATLYWTLYDAARQRAMPADTAAILVAALLAINVPLSGTIANAQ